MNFNYEDDLEVERRIKNMKKTISEEAKRDFTEDDLIDALIRAKQKRESKKDVLRQTIEEAKEVREKALANTRMKLEAFSTQRQNFLDTDGIRRLQKLAGIISDVADNNKSNYGVSGKIGASGTSGPMGTSGTAGNPLNAFHNISPFTELMKLSTEKKSMSIEESLNNLVDSEFKESVKKLYESYKIN